MNYNILVSKIISRTLNSNDLPLIAINCKHHPGHVWSNWWPSTENTSLKYFEHLKHFENQDPSRPLHSAWLSRMLCCSSNKSSAVDRNGNLTFNHSIFWGLEEIRFRLFVQPSQYVDWSSPSIPSASSIPSMPNTQSSQSIPRVRSISSNPISPGIPRAMVTSSIQNYPRAIWPHFSSCTNHKSLNSTVETIIEVFCQ